MFHSKYKLAERIITPINYLSEADLYAERGNEFLFDVECYRNYFLIGFMSFVSGRVTFIEQSEFEALNIEKLRWIVTNTTLTGFTSRKYDVPMLWAAMAGCNCGQLKAVNDKLVLAGKQSYQVEKECGFKQHRCNTIDLMEVAPAAAQTGRASWGS